MPQAGDQEADRQPADPFPLHDLWVHGAQQDKSLVNRHHGNGCLLDVRVSKLATFYSLVDEVGQYFSMGLEIVLVRFSH